MFKRGDVVILPQQELGGFFLTTSKKTSLSPSGCRYISRQESGVLCGSIMNDRNSNHYKFNNSRSYVGLPYNILSQLNKL